MGTRWPAMGQGRALCHYNMLFFLAGLQAIPPQLYEADSIDGASTFRQITLPLLWQSCAAPGHPPAAASAH